MYKVIICFGIVKNYGIGLIMIQISILFQKKKFHRLYKLIN